MFLFLSTNFYKYAKFKIVFKLVFVACFIVVSISLVNVCFWPTPPTDGSGAVGTFFDPPSLPGGLGDFKWDRIVRPGLREIEWNRIVESANSQYLASLTTFDSTDLECDSHSVSMPDLVAPDSDSVSMPDLVAPESDSDSIPDLVASESDSDSIPDLVGSGSVPDFTLGWSIFAASLILILLISQKL